MWGLGLQPRPSLPGPPETVLRLFPTHFGPRPAPGDSLETPVRGGRGCSLGVQIGNRIGRGHGGWGRGGLG